MSDKFPLSKDDYSVNDNDTVCPECGYKMRVAMCDMPHSANDGYEWIETCEDCGKKYNVTFCVSYHFRSGYLVKDEVVV